LDTNSITALADSLVTTSDEARALSCALQKMGQDDLAALWDRFADFLAASEHHLGHRASA
jgi:hypothetical protein